MLCGPGQVPAPLWAPAFPSAQGGAGEGVLRARTCRKTVGFHGEGVDRKGPGPEVGAGWGPVGARREAGCRPALQLATPGNPQAKVNPALVETRTRGDQRGEGRGRETEPVASRAWDQRQTGPAGVQGAHGAVSEPAPDVCAARRWGYRALPHPGPLWARRGGPGAAPWLPPHVLPSPILRPGIPEGPTSRDCRATLAASWSAGSREGMPGVTE